MSNALSAGRLHTHLIFAPTWGGKAPAFLFVRQLVRLAGDGSTFNWETTAAPGGIPHATTPAPAPTPSEFQLQLSSAEDPSFFSLELPAASIARTTLVPPDTSLPQGPRTAINKRIQGGSNGLVAGWTVERTNKSAQFPGDYKLGPQSVGISRWRWNSQVWFLANI